MTIIKTKNLSKTFFKSSFDWKSLKIKKSSNTAVDEVDLEINTGEFVGFLGPNGAGKTTFLKMLSGIIYPTNGEIDILGYTPFDKNYDFLRQIGLVMGQKNQLWWDLSASDSYDLLKEIYDLDQKTFQKNLDEMVSVLGMEKLLHNRIRNMSLGERMKCEIVAALIHQPKILFLDEPTIGLDVVSAQAIRDFLKKMNQEKKCTIILTSHYMADVEALCKRVVIINKGKKIFDGNLVNLMQKYAPDKRVEIYLPTIEDKEKFAHIKAKKKLWEGKGIISVEKENLGKIVEEVFNKFPAENILISDPETEEVISKIFREK
jgi:ABC-2 type transport system ATP-binding protein